MDTISIKGITTEDFVNYKKPAMFIAFPNCSFKCGEEICQNSSLAHQETITVPIESVVKQYVENDITSAIVCGGLEPFDSFDELIALISAIRNSKTSKSDDEIVIFTGYFEHEINLSLQMLSYFPNIIVKFGRYIPDSPQVYDKELGVWLASDNQYAKRLVYGDYE